jgi:hypothetical protein
MLFKKNKHVGGYIGSSVLPESSFISSSANGAYSPNEINVFKKRAKWPILGEADTNFSNVVFLLAADGINGSVVLNDSSSYNHTINIVGNAELRTDIKKFGSSSLYVFGGSANIASLSSNNWNFNTNDFTIECWIYPTSGIGASRDILSKFTTLSSNLDFLLEIDSANGNLKFSAGNNATISILSNAAIPLNTWTNVAVSRVSGVTRMFIDGVLQSATHTGSVSINNSTTTLTIGKSSTNSDPFSGYIDEIRITRNAGRYSSSFTPYNGRFSNFGLDPTTPGVPIGLSSVAGDARLLLNWLEPSNNGGSSITGYVVEYTPSGGSPTTINTGSSSASYLLTGLNNGTTYTFRVAAANIVGTGSYSTVSSAVAPTSGDSLFGNVALLLNMDGTGNTFVDSSAAPKTITAVGSATQSTSQSKFGNKSAFFDGAGSRLTIPANAAFHFGSGDYTVEAWLYIPSLAASGSGNFFSQSANVSNNFNRQHAFSVSADGLRVYWTTTGGNDNTLTFATTPPTNQWIHVAFARQSGVLRAYLNGAQVGTSQAHTATYFNSTANVCVGSFGEYAPDGYEYLDYTGYIDDLRITVGSARSYTGSTITVPTAAFHTFGPMSAPTSLAETAGNAQVSLTWTAPSFNGGSAITDYSVQFSSNSGSTWTTVSRTASTTASQVVTGLTNGTAYVFRVAGINSNGTGTYTAASSSVTPAAGLIVTGGTVTTPGDGYTYRTFTSDGTLNIAGTSLTCDVLVVGAGGPGSWGRSGGGGGGGGVLHAINQSIATGSYPITVAGTTTRSGYPNATANGGSSSIAAIYVATGGSGGIVSGNYRHRGGTSGFPTTTSNSVGNAGGTGSDCDEGLDSGGGGGGAGGVGSNAPCNASASGGTGRTVFGLTYGAGGRGGSEGYDARVDGTANRGQGGSGGQSNGVNTSGNGGSGVVIIRYAVA